MTDDVRIDGPTVYPVELVTFSGGAVIFPVIDWPRFRTGAGGTDQYGTPVDQVAGAYPYVSDESDASWVAPMPFANPTEDDPSRDAVSTWGIVARLPAVDLAGWGSVRIDVRYRNVGPHPAPDATSYTGEVLQWSRFMDGFDQGRAASFYLDGSVTEWTRGGIDLGLADTEDAMPYALPRAWAESGDVGIIAVFPVSTLFTPVAPSWPIQVSAVSLTPYRWAPAVTPPLRWIQRSDGLGAGSPRTRQRSTIQTSNRSRGIV